MGELISAYKSAFQVFGFFSNLWFFQVWKQPCFLSVFNLRFFQVFHRLISVILFGCNLKNSGLDFWCSAHSQLSPQTEKISGWTWENLVLNLRKYLPLEFCWFATWKNSGLDFWCSAHSQLLPQTEKNLRLNLRKSRVEPEKISGLNFSFDFFIVPSWEADDKFSVAMLQFKFSNKPEFF